MPGEQPRRRARAAGRNAASLIGFRGLQGFGAGLLFPLMQTLAVRAAGGKASPALIGLISMPLALGPILGPGDRRGDPQRAELALAVPGQRAGDRDRPAAGLAAAARRPAELRAEFLGQRGSAVAEVVDRAVERGEADPARLTPRIIDLPFDLFRHELMMTLKPVPDHVLRQIVDDIFLPLVAVRLPGKLAWTVDDRLPQQALRETRVRLPAGLPGLPAEVGERP